MRGILSALVFLASSQTAWAVPPNTLSCSASSGSSNASVAYFDFYPTSGSIFTAQQVRYTRKLNSSDDEALSTLYNVESIVSFGSRTGFNMRDGSWLALSPQTKGIFQVRFKDEASKEDSFFALCGFAVPVPGITANN